jgi:Bacterial lectin
MRFVCLLRTVLVGITAAVCVGLAAAQQIQFPSFSATQDPTVVPGLKALVMNGMNTPPHLATWNSKDGKPNVLRLTDGDPGKGAVHPEATSTWFGVLASGKTGQQPVTSGFTAYFQFQIHTAAKCCPPGDGFAFVIQNATSTDPSYGAAGAGDTARGIDDGGMGYTGIPNSLAIEFDTVMDPWDPSSNHVAVQSCGTKTNGPVHLPGSYTIGKKSGVTSCLVQPTASGSYTAGITGPSNPLPSSATPLGVNCATIPCTDGIPHDVVIEYTPPTVPSGNGTLAVWVDPGFIPGTHTPVSTATPVIFIPYNIDYTYNPSTGISLAPDSSGKNTLAYVGFTASQTNIMQAQDILAWEFTPHTETQVQQMIPPGGTEADYIFGANDTSVTYFPGFANNGCDGTTPLDPCLMTVVATPVAQNVFHAQRLDRTPFASEECIIYEGTGGNCIVYSITCQQQSNPGVNVTCPPSVPGTCLNPGNRTMDPTCIQFTTGFNTAEPVTTTNADYLKTDPIGSNNWMSIFLYYDPSAIDGRTGGQGGTPSDFVATFNPNKP